MSASVEILGVENAMSVFDRFSKNDLRKVLRKSLREGAKRSAAKAKSNVAKVTGHIRRTIKVRAGKNERDSVSVVTMVEGPREDVFYGSFVELGHKSGSRQGGGSREQVQPHPYMRPAFDETRAAAIDDVVNATNELIEQTNG